MSETRLQRRTDAILRRLVRRDAAPAVRKVLAKTRPEDVAAAMKHLTNSEQRWLYELIEDRDYLAELLTCLDDDDVRGLARDMTEKEVVQLLDRMEPDDATDVVEVLSDDLKARVIAGLEGDEGEELSELLKWPGDSAGGLMSPVVFKVPESYNCGQAIAMLQNASEELDSVFYLYMVDDHERLCGVTSLRTLLVHPPGTSLASVMKTKVIFVYPGQDQEEVAQVVARYDLLGVPVVDEERHLLGIITVDDVIDVIREEAAEDMMLMAGVAEPVESTARSIVKMARKRAGWLLATIVGGILAAELIGQYNDTLKFVLLAGFIPVIMGMGGNVGIQSATIAVRGLATGHVQIGGAVAFIWREARVGIVLGVLYGVLLGGYALIRYWDDPVVGLAVGISIFGAIALASIMGASIPVVLSRLGVDPAIATGPFVTTGVDIVGILVYFNVFSLLNKMGV